MQHHTPAEDLYTMELPIPDDEIARFCNIAKLVRHLSYIEDAGKMCPECCAIASECIYRLIGLKHSENPQDLLMRLQSLQASCTSSCGVAGFIPWLSSSLVALDLAFGPEVNDLAVISSLLHVRDLCKSVESFTFTLDSSEYSHARDGVIDALCAAILAMPKLRMVTLPSELVTRPVVDALAHLKCLDTVACTPAMLPVAGDRAFTHSILSTTTSRSTESNVTPLDLEHVLGLPPLSRTYHSIPSIVTSCFYALHNARTSPARSQREVASTVAMYNSTLVSFSAQQSPHERVAVLEDVLAGSRNPL
ncbi:hypothetical protein PILCRDRAFT_682039 [Piloderma croceum F 1598]|uniref:Uncharacterized protein n=1 Tax=Piloderma croceum (strain F 1598) TaxID=765440 RepID=A0A0C3AMU1_PILCF|nr:hypothetical protein PILCRDRAFT_682039 [Piloderma croceum F 1598]